MMNTKSVKRPQTIGEMIKLLQNGTPCEVVATHQEVTEIKLEGMSILNAQYQVQYIVQPSHNEGWLLFLPLPLKMLIYCISEKEYKKLRMPQEVQMLVYDQNQFAWKITHNQNGIFITFMADAYFKETYFTCKIQNNESVSIINTNYIHIKNSSDAMLNSISNIITQNYTDEIWEIITSMFVNRLTHNKELLTTETA